MVAVAKVSEHGIDVAGTLADRPAKAHHGARYFADDICRTLVKNDRAMSWFASDGRGLYDSSLDLLADNFHQDTLNSSIWSVDSGSDAQALDPGITANKLTLVSGNAGSGDAADQSLITGAGLDSLVSAGPTKFYARIYFSEVANTAFFVGLTDVLAATTLEMPFTLATTVYTSNATDAVGFLFDTAATTDTIRCVGVAGGTDAAHVDTAQAAAKETWYELAIELSAAGVARFYIDGTLVATINGCAATTATLTPVLTVSSRTTASRTMTATAVSCNQDA